MSKTDQKSLLAQWTASLKFYAQTPSQAVFLIAAAVSFVMLIPLLQQSQYLAQKAYLHDVTYLWPRLTDLYVSLIGYLIFSRLRQACTLKLKPIIYKHISPKYSGQIRDDKATKSATYVFKLGYYLTAIVCGYLALGDQDFTPWTLFGSGDSIECFKNYPYSPLPDKVKHYYFMALTYHLDSFVAHAVSNPNKDYGELYFHHTVTLILIVFSYSCNFMGGGSLVLYVHDFAEIFVSLCRIFIDLKLHKAFTVVPFFALLATWILTRCIIFPWSVAYTGVYRSAQKYNVPAPIGVLQCFQWMLCVMHYYWLGLFLKIGSTFIFKKKIVDMVADGATAPSASH